jgi:hypothetical protein
LTQSNLPLKELEQLEKALNSETRVVNIRLREGEYQCSLAKALAAFELELVFPDAKTLIRRLYGEKKTEDPQFVAKIQTILKKMEKMGIVKILPKEKPWELQRYTLMSFKFQDVEKNEVILATKVEIEKTKALMNVRPGQEKIVKSRSKNMNTRIYLLASIVVISFAFILWTLAQPSINLIFFVSAFCVAAACSTVLGVSIARKK